MKRLLLLLVGIFSIVAVRAQMPHPDVLSDMIIKTLETRDWFSNYESYTICFKYDGIEYPAEELNADIINGLMRQLNKKSPNYRFRYAAPYRHESESIRKYTRRNRIKLPCCVMYLWIELTDSHETHIFAEPRRLNPAWKRATFMLSDGESFTWNYNFARSRYEIVNTANKRNWNDSTKYRFESTNLGKLEIHRAQQIDDVNCFSDITRQISNKKCRYTRVISRDDKKNKAKVGRIKLHLDDYMKRYSQIIDDSGIINYDCDTLYIRSCTYVPAFRTTYAFKCNKGIYAFTDEGLTPCDFSHLQSSEEMFAIYKGYPDAEKYARKRYDYHLFSYEYEMAPFTLWDNERLIRNLHDKSDYGEDVIRIIIHDHKVVYFDVWSW